MDISMYDNVGGLQDQKAQPSDDHVLQKPPNSKAMGPLSEEDASKTDESVASQIDAE